MTIETNTIDLTRRSTETGKLLTATVYDVTYDNGVSRTLSMAQLVLAVCLQRATEMEDVVVALMSEVAHVTANITALTDIEAAILKDPSQPTTAIKGSWTVWTSDGQGGYKSTTCRTASEVLDLFKIPNDPSLGAETILDNIEAKLDELNTLSQDQMITLQSQTNKRDQAYEMISNVLKSLYTTVNAIVSNV